jgi:hypothetical protein
VVGAAEALNVGFESGLCIVTILAQLSGELSNSFLDPILIKCGAAVEVALLRLVKSSSINDAVLSGGLVDESP